MFREVYKNKRVLVTGNTGFKGAWLSQWLLQLGADVYGASLDIPTNPSLFEVLRLDETTKHTWLDIRDQQKVFEYIDLIRPDFIFHLAAQAIVSESYADPLGTIHTNVLGTANILDALKRTAHPCIAILVSSDKCYENRERQQGYSEKDPLGGKDVYSASKAAMELIVYSYYHSFFKLKGSPTCLVSARAGNVIGGGDWAKNRIVPDCFRAWSEHRPVEIRNPSSVRPWQHVLDPLSGYLGAGQLLYENEQLNGEAFNFGPTPDSDHTVLDMLNTLGKSWSFAPGAEKYHCPGKTPAFHEAGLLKLDCEKAAAVLGWQSSFNFEESVLSTAEWYTHFYKGGKEMIEFTGKQISQYTEAAIRKNRSWTA